jgi:hypothetical protein
MLACADGAERGCARGSHHARTGDHACGLARNLSPGRAAFAFARSLDALKHGEIFYPLDIDENQGVQPNYNVITGTQGDGSIGIACDHDSVYTYGDLLSTTGGWTARGTAACNGPPGHLYCLGVGSNDEQVPGPISDGTRVAFVAEHFNLGDSPDLTCQTQGAGLGRSNGQPRTFAALLASSTATAASKFPSTTVNNTPWHRVDGVRLADDAASFMAGILIAPLNVTADGRYYGPTPVVTGARYPTDAPQATCGDWNSASPSLSGMYGLPSAIGGPAFNAGTLACNDSAFTSTLIYCLEQ